MALLPGNRTTIVVDVADRQLHDTRIRQRARFVELRHAQTESGECRATIIVVVSMYAADGEQYGPRLTGAGFSDYMVELVAANDTLVDAVTGHILAIRTSQSAADWQAELDSHAQATMLQGDFFELLRENQPILIGDMIRQHIQQADDMGRFA